MANLELAQSADHVGKVDLSQVIHMYRGQLVAYFVRAGFGADAEDLAHDVIVKARQRQRWVEEAKVPAYVAQMARRKGVDAHRRRGTKKRDHTRVLSIDAAGVADRAAAVVDQRPDPQRALELQAKVQKLLAGLSRAERELVTLVFVQDYTYEEIARQRGKKVGSIRTAVHRIKDKLRNAIGGVQ